MGSKRQRIVQDGWWIVQITVRPCSVADAWRRRTRLIAVGESRPLVGSSMSMTGRKLRNSMAALRRRFCPPEMLPLVRSSPTMPLAACSRLSLNMMSSARSALAAIGHSSGHRSRDE